MTFDEFFPEYLEAHADERTRMVHACGLLSGLAIGGVALARRKPALMLAGLAMGYLPAFVSHWVFERNQPKTFERPGLSFRADFVMVWKYLRGELDVRHAAGSVPRDATSVNATSVNATFVNATFVDAASVVEG